MHYAALCAETAPRAGSSRWAAPTRLRVQRAPRDGTAPKTRAERPVMKFVCTVARRGNTDALPGKHPRPKRANPAPKVFLATQPDPPCVQHVRQDCLPRPTMPPGACLVCPECLQIFRAHTSVCNAKPDNTVRQRPREDVYCATRGTFQALLKLCASSASRENLNGTASATLVQQRRA